MTAHYSLGPGDTAYIMAWCAWCEAADGGNVEAAKRFVHWWEETGRFYLEQYGYAVCDTGKPDRCREALEAIANAEIPGVSGGPNGASAEVMEFAQRALTLQAEGVGR